MISTQRLLGVFCNIADYAIEAVSRVISRNDETDTYKWGLLFVEKMGKPSFCGENTLFVEKQAELTGKDLKLGSFVEAQPGYLGPTMYNSHLQCKNCSKDHF